MKSLLSETQDLYSDLYKDVNGFRPYLDWDCANDIDWLNSEIENLSNRLNEQMESDKIESEVRINEFEKYVTGLMELGAKDRNTAIRWIMDELNTMDPDYVCYNYGLPYGYLN